MRASGSTVAFASSTNCGFFPGRKHACFVITFPRLYPVHPLSLQSSIRSPLAAAQVAAHILEAYCSIKAYRCDGSLPYLFYYPMFLSSRACHGIF